MSQAATKPLLKLPAENCLLYVELRRGHRAVQQLWVPFGIPCIRVGQEVPVAIIPATAGCSHVGAVHRMRIQKDCITHLLLALFTILMQISWQCLNRKVWPEERKSYFITVYPIILKCDFIAVLILSQFLSHLQNQQPFLLCLLMDYLLNSNINFLVIFTK